MKKALGVDIGNVIIDNRTIANSVIDDEKQYLTIPPVIGAFEGLTGLTKEFSRNVFLVSKCTPWAEEKILKWLKNQDFYNKTGIKPENVCFVRERHEKEEICSARGVTHFIDDRLEVLSHMVGKVPNLYLFQPDQVEIDEYEEFLPKVVRVESWKELLTKLF